MDEGSACKYEQVHVHAVYEEIAGHFSSTRYKPWPMTSKFLLSLEQGSIGLDIGCGNGKNMSVNPNIYMLGSDRSTSLVKIAEEKTAGNILVGDILQLPHRAATFDFFICIAVVHHLATRERRINAIAGMISLLNSDGAGLVHVWALEQKDSRRGWHEGGEQDVMVPWIVKGQTVEDGKEKVVQRYYHLYQRGELEEDVKQAGGLVKSSGYEKDNWWAIIARAS